MKLLALFLFLFSNFTFAEIEDGSVEMRFPVTKTKAADIILVVDNSGSMTNFHTTVVSKIPLMMKALDTNTSRKKDYRFMVVSTDINDKPYGIVDTVTSIKVAKDLETLIFGVGNEGSPNEEHFSVVLNQVNFPSFNLFKRDNVPLEVIIITDEDNKQETITKEDFKTAMEKKFFTVNYSAFLANSRDQKLSFGWGHFPESIEWLVTSTNGIVVNWCDETVSTDDQVTRLFTDIKSRAALPAFVSAPVSELVLQENVDIHSIEVSWGGNIFTAGDADFGWVYSPVERKLTIGSGIRLKVDENSPDFVIKYDLK